MYGYKKPSLYFNQIILHIFLKISVILPGKEEFINIKSRIYVDESFYSFQSYTLIVAFLKIKR